MKTQSWKFGTLITYDRRKRLNRTKNRISIFIVKKIGVKNGRMESKSY